jgi:hypothetical protein
MGAKWAPIGCQNGFGADGSAVELSGQEGCKSLACKGVTGMGDTGLEPVTPCVSSRESLFQTSLQAQERGFSCGNGRSLNPLRWRYTGASVALRWSYRLDDTKQTPELPRLPRKHRRTYVHRRYSSVGILSQPETQMSVGPTHLWVLLAK